MDNQVLKLSEQAAVMLLTKAVKQDGLLSPEEAALLALYFRGIQTETGANYPFFPRAVADIDGALAHAASLGRSGGAS